MSLLTATNLAKSFGADDIFDSISLEIPHRARVALVGPNGAGKTTLLNLLIGADVPDEGSIALARGTRIGFLPQRPELHGDHILWEEMLAAFTDLRRMENRLRDLEHDLADPAKHDSALAAYGDLQHRFEEAGGYLYETRIKTVLNGLGFKPEQYQVPLGRLSGGQKTRALLGRLLLDSPDLLVLDEPTNHLDIQAVEWLEGFLKDFPGAVLAVSHDRYFMDAFASTVWEMDFGTLETYRGNYSHYVQQREERYERRQKEYEAQQEFLAKEMDYIRRNIAGQNTRQAKGKLRRLETMKKRGKLLTRPRNRQTMNLNMNESMRSGNKVITTVNVAVGYADAPAPLFTVPDLTLWRGEVAALIGPNGVGKSTFLKTILGQLPPLGGEVKIGASVEIGYFAQAHELLNPNRTIIDTIMDASGMNPAEARNFLGPFLFQGDDVFRSIGTLSGGERGRVALAKLALSGANLLLLDEPTNHLDIDSQEMLQNVLAGFNGTILLVSHDRYLIDALATQIWAAAPGQMEVFEGTYTEWMAAKAAKAASDPLPVPGKKPSANGDQPSAQPVSSNLKPETKKHGLNPYQLQKRVAKVEEQIEKLESKVAELEAALTAASTNGEYTKVESLGAQYTQAEADLHAAMAEWEQLME
ncbi:MAG TPA: ABC-F family ATP-binding cassette domain-containing protein [Aggregatilineales bacterium]|nr:ABC-F family ATP-binding cassette domain-containing protein [Aggregatilineales bacterium]